MLIHRRFADRLCRRSSLCLAAICWLLLAGQARGVLFFWTADPSYNTRAPTGTLTNSGWQYQGHWGHFSGTVISSNSFISTRHVGGAVGQSFMFRGTNYATTAFFDDPESDLRVWRVNGAFPEWAPLYTRKNERGKTMMLIGRGTQRGAPIWLNYRLKGWEWGAWDHVQRWGQNRVKQVFTGGPGVGELLGATFDFAGPRNEAQLSSGDSGGAAFIKDGRVYKLAGIHFSADGVYSRTNREPGIKAAVFDERELYKQDAGGNWVAIPNKGGRRPGYFYCTRISSRAAWIRSIVAP